MPLYTPRTLGVPYAGARAAGRASRSQQQPLTPEEQRSLASELIGVGTSSVGLLASILDTPGSWIRNTLAVENPFKGTFDYEERKTGREMLEKWGALDENVEGLDWGDVAGFGAEVLLDPLTYLGLGTVRGATTSGQILHRTGAKYLPQPILEKAAKASKPKLAPGGGRRAQMEKMSLQDIINKHPGARKEFKKAAEGMRGVDFDAVLASGERLASPAKWFGQHLGGQRLARGMDVLGHGLSLIHI